MSDLFKEFVSCALSLASPWVIDRIELNKQDKVVSIYLQYEFNELGVEKKHADESKHISVEIDANEIKPVRIMPMLNYKTLIYAPTVWEIENHQRVCRLESPWEKQFPNPLRNTRIL